MQRDQAAAEEATRRANDTHKEAIRWRHIAEIYRKALELDDFALASTNVWSTPALTLPMHSRAKVGV